MSHKCWSLRVNHPLLPSIIAADLLENKDVYLNRPRSHVRSNSPFVLPANYTRQFLDDNLTWKSHISLSASKLSKSIGIIHKSRFFLSTHSLRTLYNSMILPYLYYCNLHVAYKSNLQRIVILQKHVLRIVSNSTYDAHTGPIFKELKLLKFHDIHSLQLGIFMFSFKNSTLPSKFNNFFLLNSQIHNYNTRNAQSFRLPLCRTNTRKFSIYFQGPKFYNSLNSDITSSSSSASFKRKLKEFLLSKY